jgi:hypothetical protein
MREENGEGGVAVATFVVVAVLVAVGLLAGHSGGGATVQSPLTWAIGVRLSLAR